MINRIAEFLKMRDESVLPSEVDEDERRGSAIAILDLMREPTDAMLDAYWRQTGESKEMRSRTHAYMRRYFSAMINAALKESP